MLAALPNVKPESDPVQAIRAAFATWESVSTSDIAFHEAGFTRAASVDVRDGIDVVTFADTPANRELFGDSNAVAVTVFTTVLSQGATQAVIAGADIVFNPRQTFSTRGDADAFDIQSIATHEIGHFIGLDHSGLINATMFFSTGRGMTVQRTLSHDDVAAASAAYPNASAAAQLGSATGKVLSGGSPLFGALIVMVNTTNRAMVGSITGRDGSFRVDGVPPGQYLVYTEPLDGPLTHEQLGGIFDGSVKVDFRTTFFGGNASPATVKISAGSETKNIDIEVDARPPSINITFAGIAAEGQLRSVSSIGAPLIARPGGRFEVGIFGNNLSAQVAPSKISVVGSDVSIVAGSIKSARLQNEATGFTFLIEVSANALSGPCTILVGSDSEVAALSGAIEVVDPNPVSEPEATLYLPRVVLSGASFNSISVVNTTTKGARLTLRYFEDSGQLVSWLTNPRTFDLAAKGRTTLVAGQAFGYSGERALGGWVEITTDNSGVIAFMLEGDTAMTYLDGVEASAQAFERLAFPIAVQREKFATEVSLVNPSRKDAAQVELRLYSSLGELIKSAKLMLPPRGRVAASIAQIFGISAIEGGYIEASSSLGLVGAQFAGEVPRSDGGERNRLAALRARSPQGQTLLAPQFVVGGGFSSALILANASNQPISATVTLVGDNGAALLGPLRVTVPSKGTILADANALGLSPRSTSLMQGYLRVEAGAEGLTGAVIFEDAAGSVFLAYMPLLYSAARESYLPHAVMGAADVLTGLACVNPNSQAADISIQVFNEQGDQTAGAELRLGAGAHFARTLEELTGFTGTQRGGYVRINSSLPVTSLGLLISQRSLAVVPAQVPGQ